MTSQPSFQAMQGGGYYNRNSTMQSAILPSVLPVWQTALAQVPIGAEMITIADYGSSQGANSMAPVAIAIDALRGRSDPSRPVEVLHTDLPSNDYASLFQLLESDASYRHGRADIFPAAIGRSFYGQIIPNDRVHAGWCTWAVHWMSKRLAAPDHIFAGLSRDDAVRAAVSRIQAADWSTFLDCRARELRPGGVLLVTVSSRGAGGSAWQPLLDDLSSCLRDMHEAGIVSADELAQIAVPAGPRTIESITAPFPGGRSANGLVLAHCQTDPVPDPVWNAYESTGDLGAFVRNRVAITRAWAGPSIAGTFAPDRDPERLVDALFVRLEAKIAARPAPLNPEVTVVVLTKSRDGRL